MNESLHSLLLAQALGLYLVIVAIIMISRAKYYQNILTRAHEGSSSLVVAGTVGLILGIILVLIHNIWVMEIEVLITLVAWLILIKSILWLGFPEMMVNYTHKAYQGAGYYIIAIIAGIVGVILLSYGFHYFNITHIK